jgi:hypothetical protein
MSLNPPEDRFQHRANVVVTAPALEPVTLHDVKLQARISDDAEDSLAVDAITEAREMVEDYLGCSLINTTWKVTFDNWPGGDRDQWWSGTRDGHIRELHAPGSRSVVIPRWPLSSITSVTTYDEGSNSTAVTVANVFDTDTASTPGRLALQSGSTWPVALRPTNAIEIVYVAGYGASAADVPAPLRRAIRNIAAYLITHRGDCEGPEDIFTGSGARHILQQYRVVRL